MKKNGISTFKVASTYIGTIIGAGFASGQEILQFFGRFGLKGIYGLIITTVLFGYFGFIIMDLGRKLKAHSHLEIIKYSSGKFLSIALDSIITFFLFGALTAMIAGTGALFLEQFNIASIWGNILMAVITALTVLAGINGVINSITILVPLLILSVFSINIFTIIKTPPLLAADPVPIGDNGLIGHWTIAAFLYTAYNMVIGIGVLGPLGVEANKKASVFKGAVFGGIGLGISSMMIYLALSTDIMSLKDVEVPMVSISGEISPTIQLIYAIVLIAGIYTTAVGSLFAFVARVIHTGHSAIKQKMIIIMTTTFAFFASQFGFSNLVKYLYPLVGYCGIVMLVCLVYSHFKFMHMKSYKT